MVGCIVIKQAYKNFRFGVFPFPLLHLNRKYKFGNIAVQDESYETLYSLNCCLASGYCKSELVRYCWGDKPTICLNRRLK